MARAAPAANPKTASPAGEPIFDATRRLLAARGGELVLAGPLGLRHAVPGALDIPDDLPGWSALVPDVLPDHRARMEALVGALPLRQETLTIAGRTYPTPRLTSWHGDPGCAYAYSGRLFTPVPWTPELADLRDLLAGLLDCRFNSVLCNYYRDGSDSMGAHADKEPELGPTRDNIVIASLSLGAPRRFILRHETTRDQVEHLLGDGNLLVMGGALQRYCTHRVPKTRVPVPPRMNLTFRVIRTLQLQA
jgi:alkylated DNA repair dioxygenase AlkB